MRALSKLKTRIPYFVLFAAGMNLILIQWVLVRELTALLFGTELVVMLVSAAYFAGISVGYLAAGHIKRGLLAPLGVLTLVLHLTLPVWFRLLATALNAVDAFGLAFAVLPLLTVFVVPAFYSIFLPHFADTEGEIQYSLASLYAVELLGSVCGVGVLVVLGGVGLDVVYVIYTAGMVGILLGLEVWPLVVMMLAFTAGLWLLIFPQVNAWSNSLFFTGLQGLPAGTRTLFTGYSPYQKVDVLESPAGQVYLYLDGLRHFGSESGSRLNVMMGEIPARLMQPESALVIGAGSMEMERMIAAYAGHVTTVEIDPMVVDVSRRHFDAFNRLSTLDNRTIIVDDAKHYAANTASRFDLIATDTPAAFTIQTATLYSKAFFQTLKARMNSGGLLVVNLTGMFDEDNLISRRIAAGLVNTFEVVVVVNAPSAGWSFAYAGDALPFTLDALRDALIESGEEAPVVYDSDEVRAVVADIKHPADTAHPAAPITLDSMDIVLEISGRRILRLWGLE